MFEPEGRVFRRRRVRLARVLTEEHRGPALILRGRRDGGGLFFGDFLLATQKKVTCVCCTGMYEFRGSAGCAGAISTTHKYSSYIDNCADRRTTKKHKSLDSGFRRNDASSWVSHP
ncbi:MAG: hypothetical protein A2W18_02315 [Candidatus Muproteobacteria bacterium RBG_16_60_9]|uniref:Uncharacterized protein n=1 Tax=Candidatus Muproteobacteria bacterium RBG_16_60_9 TaxID=1817755 RepID=A0A1F6UVG6_9PROT|nr:MAG: hypothetical protein A2W18_02315 [Candidatus Muproteobacteria bacterium RBG_16_60_9]